MILGVLETIESIGSKKRCHDKLIVTRLAFHDLLVLVHRLSPFAPWCSASSTTTMTPKTATILLRGSLDGIASSPKSPPCTAESIHHLVPFGSNTATAGANRFGHFTT